VSGRRVYMHPDELPLTVALAATDYASVKEYANPVDRGRSCRCRGSSRRSRRSRSCEGSLEKVVRAFDPNTGVRGLTDWQCVLTADHTPGHIAYCSRVIES
jgi:glyoxylase-like metal-dependent hydrolase (beta-lactamase superfamily II)